MVTPIARNTWKGLDGTYNDLLAEYAQAVKRLGTERKVPVVDLHAASRNFVLVKGLEAAKQWFYPNDFTHSNDYGRLSGGRLGGAGTCRIRWKDGPGRRTGGGR